MNKHSFSLIFLASYLLSTGTNLSYATELYKTTDANGNIVFTDVPPKESAEPIKLPKTNTIPGIKKRSLGSAPEASENSDYESLRIISPSNDATVRAYNAPITIAVQLTPGLNLKKNHRIHILLDGNVISKGTQTSAKITELDRGTHTISAKVIDQNKKTVISAQAITIHAKQPSAL